MKIKTVTCHHVYNYGATLQAYALQTYLEMAGNDVEIIDYRLPTQTRYQLFTPFPAGRAYEAIKKLPWLRYVICPFRNRKMLLTWGRKRAFDDFDYRFLHITPVTYHNIKEIRNNPPEADLYIAGSDQIWNTETSNGTDEGYYLDFGSPDIRRISYAASFGVSKIQDELKDFVATELRKFEKLSVRETAGLKILNDLGLNGTLVVDPVFLLSKEQWINNLRLSKTDENYILLYDFLHDDTSIRDFSKSLAKHTGLRILSVNDISEAPYADVQVNNAGPKEFLQYIMNARYVVSNSFHATAFSLIFNKEFATFPLVSQHNSSRMENLLQDMNMSDRLSPGDITIFDRQINWGDVAACLSPSVSRSKDFLKF